MATLVLTAVGTALGGPIGAAIGALAGQAIDARLFAPKPRHGPRLGDLAVQTSSYGAAIPKIFGTMRVAGTVIWSTDLQERRARSGGGKGRPKTIEYSYSASFAVALSGRPIRAVRRIWADGKLLRGAAGDLKTETKYRLYTGDEDQPVDPLIASAEGVTGSPAFRGIAYAMFEDFQLADFGNRIPLLTFEVEADAGDIAIGTMADELSEAVVGGGPTPELAGYAALGDSVRGVLEDLASVFPLSVQDDGQALRLAVPGGTPILLGRSERDASLADAKGRDERTRRGRVPDEVGVSHYEPGRDYQTGLQRAVRPGGGTGLTERVALPAVLGADAAKALAEARLARLEAERTGAVVYLGWRRAPLRPGTTVRLEGTNEVWRVARWSFEQMRVRLELLRVPGSAPASATGTPGRPVSQPDLKIGATILRLLDAPLYGDRPADRPVLHVAAAGAEPGWRGALLSVSHDDGASWQPAGSTAAPAVLGTAVTALPAGGSALLDQRHEIEVELLNEAMGLEGQTDQALAGGANMAVIGDELVQFGRAEQIGPRRWRLSRLLRGRFGTEWAGEHTAGEPFVVIETETLAGVEMSAAMIGSAVAVLAVGLADGPDGVQASRSVSGEVLRPPSPVHLRALREEDGAVLVRWVRRSRTGWRWLDGAEAPIGEEAERYEVIVSDGSGAGRRVELSEAEYRYDTAMQQTDQVTGPLTIEVVQLGTFGRSRPTRTTIS
jgi:hypothetical protein